MVRALGCRPRSCGFKSRRSCQKNKFASVVELVDTPDLGSGGEIRTGSNPVGGTKSLCGKGRLIRFAWDEENEGSNPSTETILGSSQVVRHWILAPAFIGSNPIFPANFIKMLRDRGMVTSLGS